MFWSEPCYLLPLLKELENSYRGLLNLQNKENELIEVVLDIQIQQFSRNHGQIKRDDNKVTGKLDCMLVVYGKKQRLFTVRQKRKMM